MQHQKPITDGSELVRALRRSPKHLANLRSRLLAEIVRARANSRTLVSPTKLIGSGRPR